MPIPVSFNCNTNPRGQNYRNWKNMLIHTTLYPKFHCTHKVNSSVSESTTPKDVPFHSQMQNELKKRVKDPLCSSNKFCFCCTRRHFMAALGAAALLPIHPSHASDVSSPANPMVKYIMLHFYSFTIYTLCLIGHRV